MRLVKSEPFKFESKEYETRVSYDDALRRYEVRAFLNNEPANPYVYTVSHDTVSDFGGEAGNTLIDELLRAARADVTEKAWENKPLPDIAVRDRDGKLQLVVEVNTKRDASPDWATQLRRNLYAHDVVPKSPYLLIATPKSSFLWTNNSLVLEPVAPDCVLNTSEIVVPAADGARDTQERSEFAWALALSAWLQSVTSGPVDPTANTPAAQRLVQSGLYSAIRGGRVTVEPSR